MKQQFNQPAIKSFLIIIYAILAVVCSVFAILLWNGFNHIEAVESKLAIQQKSVVLIKDIQFHTVQIQQYLTDVGATHRQAGFREAEEPFARRGSGSSGTWRFAAGFAGILQTTSAATGFNAC